MIPCFVIKVNDVQSVKPYPLFSLKRFQAPWKASSSTLGMVVEGDVNKASPSLRASSCLFNMHSMKVIVSLKMKSVAKISLEESRLFQSS